MITERKKLEEYYRLLCGTRFTQEKIVEHQIPPGYVEFGEEAITIGALTALRPDDPVNVYFRGDKTAIKYKLGLSAGEHFALLTNKKTDPDVVPPEGYCYPDKGLVGKSSSCLGSELDLCCGAALAISLQKADRVVLNFSGDGSTSKGNYHEVYNFSALRKLPIIFMVRHNHWAMSSSLAETLNVPMVYKVAETFGIKTRVIDGNDVIAVNEAVTEAAAYCREGNGPYLIEAMTYRMAPHSSHDEDDYYRDPEVLEAWKEKDPILVMKNHLLFAGFTQAEIDKITDEVRDEIEEGWEWAAKLPRITPEESLKRQSDVIDKMMGRA